MANLPYRVSRSTLTAVGRSQLLARWPGTHSRILSAIHRAAQTVLGSTVTSAGWQVTLCDPVWHVSSRSGVATLRTAIHLLLTYVLTYLKRTCSRVTSASSALGVLTIMRYTNPRTHSLTLTQRIPVDSCGQHAARASAQQQTRVYQPQRLKRLNTHLLIECVYFSVISRT